MKKAYFCTVQLATGEWVELIYESGSRKGTSPHYFDLYFSIPSDLKLKSYSIDTTTDCFLLNKKNKDEQCFGDHRIIDLR